MKLWCNVLWCGTLWYGTGRVWDAMAWDGNLLGAMRFYGMLRCGMVIFSSIIRCVVLSSY